MKEYKLYSSKATKQLQKIFGALLSKVYLVLTVYDTGDVEGDTDGDLLCRKAPLTALSYYPLLLEFTNGKIVYVLGNESGIFLEEKETLEDYPSSN